MAKLTAKSAMTYCSSCPIFEKCGGLVVDGESELSCMHRCGDCTSQKGACPFACPNNEERYVWMVAEIEALDYVPKIQLHGPKLGGLPFFAPQILHGSRRWRPLETSPVAISIADLLSRTDPEDDRKAVRRKFGLLDETQIIALGVARDHLLERWWGTRHEVTKRLLRMDLQMVTTPNFSIFYNAPRQQTLVSFARIHHFSEVISAAGIPVVPHVYAETDHDWKRWKLVLQSQPSVHVIAMEFQTTGDDEFAKRYIAKLARLRDEVARPLHLIAIGGARYAGEIIKAFPLQCTITEASSFSKTRCRSRVGAPARDPDRPSLTRFCDLADLLDENIAAQEKRIRRRANYPAMG